MSIITERAVRHNIMIRRTEKGNRFGYEQREMWDIYAMPHCGTAEIHIDMYRRAYHEHDLYNIYGIGSSFRQTCDICETCGIANGGPRDGVGEAG